MKIEQMPVKDLKPYERNAKKHDETQVKNVMESIKQFGFAQPLVVDKDNVLIIGHCRLIAAKRLKMNDVPVVRMDELTQEQVDKLRLLDNKLNESEWDFDLLAEDVPQLDWDGFDIDWELPLDNIDSEIDNNEESEIEDVEKLEKHYGVPYQGNKSRIADIIINLLPEGNRLVDLFGGGGAITHCAMLSGKWSEYLYNDINPLITTFFIDAVNGKYHDEKRVITRADFEAQKDSDPYVKYLWSFGNNGTGYLWGADIEDVKIAACHSIMDETPSERRMAYIKYTKLFKEKAREIKQGILSINRLQSLEHLEALQRLEVSNIDFHDYKYKEGDIVYCDVPYEQKGKKACDDYGVSFDSLDFYKWAKEQPYQVFFSSYEISDKDFYKIKIKSVMSLIGANTNSQKVNEYLYSNMPIKKEQGDG